MNLLSDYLTDMIYAHLRFTANTFTIIFNKDIRFYLFNNFTISLILAAII